MTRIASLLVPLKRLLIKHPDLLAYVLVSGLIFYAGVRWREARIDPYIDKTAQSTAVKTVEYMYLKDLAPEPIRRPDFSIRGSPRPYRYFLKAGYDGEFATLTPGMKIFQAGRFSATIEAPVQFNDFEYEDVSISGYLKVRF